MTPSMPSPGSLGREMSRPASTRWTGSHACWACLWFGLGHTPRTVSALSSLGPCTGTSGQSLAYSWALTLPWQLGLPEYPVPLFLPFPSVGGSCLGLGYIYLLLVVRAVLILLAFRRQMGIGVLCVKYHYFITLRSNKWSVVRNGTRNRLLTFPWIK